MLSLYWRSTVIVFWLAIGRITGLLFHNIDLASGRFYCVKFYHVYSRIIQIIAICLFPYSFVRFFQSIDIVTEVDISFVKIVTAFKDCMDYVFMAIAYSAGINQRRKMRDVLNAAMAYNKFNNDNFGTSINLKKLQWTECLSINVLTKLSVLVTHAMLYFSIIKESAVHVLLMLALMMPEVCYFIVSNQYFFGVIILKQNIANIHTILRNIKSNVETYRLGKLKNLESELMASEQIDKLSQLHTKLHHLYAEFSAMYQIQMLLSIASNFFTIMINTFHLIFFQLMLAFDVTPRNANEIQIKIILSLTARIIDVYVYAGKSSSTNLMHTRIAKLASEMCCYKRDERFRKSVSLIKNKKSSFPPSSFNGMFSELETLETLQLV
jgi:7tm Chemosensory receptor